MTNLKKTLAVVLAFAMILSMGAVSTFAYSDVTAGTKTDEAVTILSNLSIIKGYEDGTFKPDETVTRAEMAAIICRTLGYESQAQSSMGTTVFTDVAADHWASGYVNVAQAQGIINGYGNGLFGPEDKVTYEQAVKMIVSALGYDLAAAQKGGYPTGYLAIASSKGVTKNANGKVGDAAKRSAIAILVYNSLEVQLMDQTSWSTGTDGDKYTTLDETILSKYLDIKKYKGVVTATPSTNTGASYDKNKTEQATIGNAIEVKYYNDKLTDYSVGNVTADADLVDTDALLGKYVIAYIGEDDTTGNDTIYAIALNEGKNTITTVAATQLVENGEKYWNTNDTVGYKTVGSSSIQDLTIASNVTIKRNFTNTLSIANVTTQALASEVTKGGTIEFICNDNDNEIEFINIISYTREAVIENVKENNGAYSFDCYVGKLPKIDTEDDDQKNIIYKDGELVEASALAASDTVSYVQVADDYNIFYVSSETVTGAVTAYDDTDQTVTIDGVDYDLSKGNTSLTASKLANEEGVFFLNVDGQIAHNETAPTQSGKYAYALAVYDETKGVNTGSYIQVVLADGTVAEYKIADKAQVVDDSNTVVTRGGAGRLVNTTAQFKGYFSDMMTAQTPTTTYKTAVADAKNASNRNLMVKLTVSGEKVTKAKLLPASSSAVGITTSKYDAESESLGALNFDGSTVVFAFKQSAGVIDPDDVKVGKITDFFVDGEDNYDVVAFDEDSSSVYGAVIGFNLTSTIKKDNNVFVVASRKTTTYNNEDAYLVSGLLNGEDTTITIYNKDGYGSQAPDALVAGDVILISELDAEGIVSDFERLVNFDKSAPSSTTTAKTSGVSDLDQIYSGFGKLTNTTTNKFTIDKAVKVDTTGNSSLSDFAAASAAISFRSAANYTLVDFSENFKNPDVTLEDGSEYTLDTAYETYVYVRVVDGKLSDVVVYRMSKAAKPVAGTIVVNDVTGNAGGTVNLSGAYTKASASDVTASITVDDTSKASVSGYDVTVADTAMAGDKITVTVKLSGAGYTTVTKTFTITVG